jgi:hypothetical protein
MGDYTPTQRFYLPDGDELVNVEQDLNYNWDRADERVKALVEMQRTDEASISVSSIPKDVGYKWFKTYTNSWYFLSAASTTAITDVNSVVTNWDVAGITFEAGYGSVNLEESRIAYAIQDGFVHLRGRLCLNGTATDLPLNTTVNFMTLPTSAMPARNKYFTVYGGNAGADFQCARLFIPESGAADPRLEFCRYGGVASSAQERYISLNGAYYGLDD